MAKYYRSKSRTKVYPVRTPAVPVKPPPQPQAPEAAPPVPPSQVSEKGETKSPEEKIEASQ
jgi:hypothetical protein